MVSTWLAERKAYKIASFLDSLDDSGFSRACLMSHILKTKEKSRKMYAVERVSKLYNSIDYFTERYFYIERQGNVIKIGSKGFLGSYGSGGNKRGMIKEFSKKSRKRMIEWIQRNKIDKDTYRLYCGTLTYEGVPNNGKKVKEDLIKFWKLLKYHYPVRSLIWVLEFQKRGSPHFHFILVVDRKIVAKGFRDIVYFRRGVAKIWNFVVKGSEKHLKAGTQLDLVKGNIVGYFAKYMKKLEQKEVPDDYNDVGRFWGVLGRNNLYKVKKYITLITEELFYILRRTVKKALYKKGYIYRFMRRFQGIIYFGDINLLGDYADIFV